jgi:hypothetical protein
MLIFKFKRKQSRLSQLMLHHSDIAVSNTNIPDLIRNMLSFNLDSARPRDDLKMTMEGIPVDQQASIIINFNRTQAQIEDQTSVKPTARSTNTVGPLVMGHPVTPANI